MCNPKCLAFVEKYLIPNDIIGKSIIDVGSRDINGSPRYYVLSHKPEKYIGVDIEKGKGVDIICDANELVKKFGRETFDIVISTELLEHIKDWRRAIQNMKDVLKPGGKIFITTRSPGFPTHNYPQDYWRFTKENMYRIFDDFDNVVIEDDDSMPGVFVFGTKSERQSSLSDIHLRNIHHSLIYGHTSFIPFSGYAAHAREFFTRLNKFYPVRIRNFAHTPNLSHLTQEQKDMVVHMTWKDPPYEIGTSFDINQYKRILNIILMETNHHYYYDEYRGPKIAYNVWESTRQPEQFFKRILKYDQLWVPTHWQRQCSVEQGYPEDRVKVVPEGVDGNIFFPKPDLKKPERFRFVIFGRWDYRKYTTEMIKAFLMEFKKTEPVELYISVDNPYPVDELKSTEERLVYYGLKDNRIHILHFPSQDYYIQMLQTSHAFLSCSRSEGWNLPLIEAIACGLPTICSDYGAQLEFADGISAKVAIKEMKRPKNVFMQSNVPGLWAEPDFEHLMFTMRDVYERYDHWQKIADDGSIKVRKEFSWDKAVNKALGIIENTFQQPDIVKLNVGAGDEKKPGYVNIDKYTSSDQKADGADLQYDAESVDEIFSSHMLEHLGKNEILKTLKDWYRILKWDGKIVLDVPDIEWCIKFFLEHAEVSVGDRPSKWEFPLDTIFGNQEHEGEYHKTGFTKERLRFLLEEAGFSDVLVKTHTSHNQECIYAEGYKRKKKLKEVFIVDCYPDTQEKIDLTVSIIEKLKKYNQPIALVSHYPIPPELSSLVNYSIYDHNNILSEGWSLNYWYITKEYKVVTKLEKKYHAAACYSSLKNAVDFLKDKFDFAHFIEFDMDADFDLYLEKTAEQRDNNKKFVGFLYIEEQLGRNIGIMANLFSFSLRWLADKLDQINSWEEYRKLSDLTAAAERANVDHVFENWLYRYFKYKNILSDAIFLSKDKKNIIRNSNVYCRVDVEPKVKFHLSETDEGQIVLFAFNISPEAKTIHMGLGDDMRAFDLKPKNGNAYVVIPRPGYLTTAKFTVDDETKEIEIDPLKSYDETIFRFKDDKIKCIRWEPIHNKGFMETEPVAPAKDETIKITFHDKAKVDITGDQNDSTYGVEFIDKDNNTSVFTGSIKINHWTAPNRRYYTDWKIKISKDGRPYSEYDFDLKGKKVYIYMDANPLGDNIAWFPYAEEFRKKHGCETYVSTYWNHLFEANYPELKFVPPGSKIENLTAMYSIGIRDNDADSNKNNWKTVPLQQVAADYLGLEYKEIKPIITVPKMKRPLEDRYICISEHSTLQAKYWNYPGGWQKVIDYLLQKGIKTMVISKEPTKLQRIINKTNSSIQQTMNNIQHCEFFMGVSAGPTWLSWAMNKPTILISGYSTRWAEMKDCVRIINEAVCHGCFNDPTLFFDRGNWWWCPRNKKFECTLAITPEKVISEIDKLLQ
jgi:autotransporter strand-loop-strand O-heptosyltransferase